MLKKTYRLSTGKDIQTTFRRGRSFFNPYFVVKFAERTRGSRFTVVASTKVSKLAVDRNRLKRLVRETIRGQVSAFRPGDYIVVIKAAARSRANPELRDSLTGLLVKTRLLKNN